MFTLRILVLMALSSTAFAAGQPIMGDCVRPEMPGLKGDKVDWQRYASAMNDYNACLGSSLKEKGDAANEKSQEVLDSVQSSLEKLGNWGSRK